MSACSILELGKGKMSTFGGPHDTGVKPDEGLALVSTNDLTVQRFRDLFLPAQPEGTTGVARRLNPLAYYCALRWDEVLAPYRWIYRVSDGLHPQTFTMLRHALVRLTNPENGICLFATPVDYGPGDGKLVDGRPTEDTGRLADLSPGAASFLLLQTDNFVRCELILPEPETEEPIIASDFGFGTTIGSKGEPAAPGGLTSGSAAPGGKETA